MYGREPQGRRSERVQVVELVDDTLEIAYAVSVRVGKGIHQQLVGNLRTLRSVPLDGVRRQHPVQSVPAFLPAFRLAGAEEQQRQEQQTYCPKFLSHNIYFI